MEFTLTICQKQIHDNFPGLDIKDAGIIDFLGRFSHDCAKKIFAGKVFYWFDYGKIATECPLLRLESEAIRKRMRTMCALGIFEAHPENRGGKIFFAFGDKYSLTHRDTKEKEREENPDLHPKRTGRKSRPQREENPVLYQKEREENPDNHKDHFNHNNQSSTEPENDADGGLKIEVHSEDLNGFKLLDFLPSKPKEITPPPDSAPSPSPGYSSGYAAFDIDTDAARLKTDQLCRDRFGRDLKIGLEKANAEFPLYVDRFVENQKAETFSYPNTKEFRRHFFNWIVKAYGMPQPGHGGAVRGNGKANINRLGSDPSVYSQPQKF